MISLILASGFGTRLQPANVHTPKGLLEYKGKPLITYIVEKIPEDIAILVNTNKRGEAAFLSWQKSLNRDVTLCVEPVFNEEQSFGAVGSLLYWIKAKQIADDLLVIASDNYFEFDLLRYIKTYSGDRTCIAVCDIGSKNQARQFGVVELEGSKIISLEEKPAAPKSSLIATACYLFPPRIFPLLSEYCATAKRDNLGSFIAYLVERDEVYAHTFSELWYDIGSIDVYNVVQQTGSR